MLKRKQIIMAVLLILSLLTAVVYGIKYAPALAGAGTQLSGSLQAPSIKVTAQSSGVIKEVSTSEGSVVSINQGLAKIENLELENAVFKAQAQLEVANARLNQINAGVRAEDKTVWSVQVKNEQTLVDGLQKTQVEINQVLGKLQVQKGEITGSLSEHISHLDKVVQEHAGHQTQPAHVHPPDDDGKEGMDCALLLAEVGNINKVLTQLNQLGNGTDKIGLKIGGAALEAQIGLLQAEAGILNNKLDQSRKDLEVAKAQLNAANASPRTEDVEMAHAQVKEAQVNLELAKKQLTRNMILAQVNGLVVTQEVNLEQYVNPGTVIFTLVDLDKMWFEIETTKAVSSLQAGSVVKAVNKLIPGKEFLGRIESITPVLGQTGVKIRVRIDNSENFLKPGMEMTLVLENQ